MTTTYFKKLILIIYSNHHQICFKYESEAGILRWFFGVVLQIDVSRGTLRIRTILNNGNLSVITIDAKQASRNVLENRTIENIPPPRETIARTHVYLTRRDHDARASPLNISLVYLYNIFFEKVSIVKPKTSRPTNSELYILAENYKGISSYELQFLYSSFIILKNYDYNTLYKIIIFFR